MARTIIENIVIQHYQNETYFSFCQYTSIRFFEILYFEKGTGVIRINGSTTNYTDNSFFVFVPDDVYTLDVETATTVTTIKFLKSYFSSLSKISSALPANNWFRKIEGILNNESHQLRALEFNSNSDKIHLASLLDILCKENIKKESFDIIIMENSLTMILHIMARNIRHVPNALSPKHQKSKIQDILNYIHSNIYDSHLINNKQLASHFSIAENYISQYFKKYMDISLKKYIINYRLKLVETRLKYTDLQFSEIALELGFTDASHLNKTFLAYKGLTIGEFKANLA